MKLVHISCRLPIFLSESIHPLFMAKLLIICALAILGCALKSQAIVYTVGDGAGWDISADFPSWIAGKTFYVGDVLSFQFSRYHTLNEVDKAGYDSCNASNALLSSSNGNTSVPLTTGGDKYFICGVRLHCLGGMKLKVGVTGNQSIAPASAPQSPGFHPQAPSSPIQKPSTDKHRLLPPPTNDSYHVAEGSMFVAWLCTFGALWLLFLRV
ncbi:blue copper protein [Phoenix dactylifera]|uniref:Blue copper protein n=1 Tax=Phoenix dactylifera TaxID=42345 RepID=A0A8B7BVN1_PHODC|nr:blue copper protein [Phoenix dactylifera]